MLSGSWLAALSLPAPSKSGAAGLSARRTGFALHSPGFPRKRRSDLSSPIALGPRGFNPVSVHAPPEALKLTIDPVRLTIYPLRMQFPVHVARTRLSRLIDAALDGEEVVISRGARPVVRLVPLPRKRSLVGALEGRMTVPDDLFEPMSEEELRLWEGE